MTLSITFRTDDNVRWGSGKGSDLTATEVDRNFYVLKSAVEQLQIDIPDAAVGIDSFTTSGSTFYVHLTDGSTQGPYDLPVSVWSFRGDWAASTVYIANEVVTNGYGVYLVLVDHQSNTTFDPNANDGFGNDYYQLMISFEPFAVPPGGTTGQVLAKNSNTDHDLVWYTLPPQVTPPGDNDLTITYLGSELVESPTLSSFPAGWSKYDSTYTSGQLSITYNEGMDPRITIPLFGLAIGSWYALEITGEIHGDLNLITTDNSNLNALAPGSCILFFQAQATSDYIQFDLWNYTDGAVRIITGVSCKKVAQPSKVTMNLEGNPFFELGMPDGNVFVGGYNAINKPFPMAASAYMRNNVAVGYGAMENAVSLVDSIAIGTGALQDAATTSNNIAIGSSALMNNKGSGNIAIGVRTMASSATGTSNIVIGNSLDGVKNAVDNVVISPQNGGRSLNTGSQNVVIGSYALYTAESNNNVSIGHFSGFRSIASSQQNVFIGAFADTYVDGYGTATTCNNAIVIGYNAKATRSNYVQLGNTSITQAYIGTKAIGLPKHLLFNGGSAGAFTVTGINTGDRIDEVIYYPAAGGVFDLTSEFSITGANGVTNTGGTATTGGKLIIRWTSLT